MSNVIELVAEPPHKAAPSEFKREGVHPRNMAVDAYRGLVMLLMMGEVLEFARVARSFPGNPVWQLLSFNQSHVEWVGMSLHDTIQPGFTFLAGVSLPYSLRRRREK